MPRCVDTTGSDDRMDCAEWYFDTINPLPKKCGTCGFPDLDFVPQPYFLVRSRTMRPDELAPAYVGNFLVRDRVKRVIELVAPGECTFYPTCFKGTTEPTPWLLAVPNNRVPVARVDPKIKRCATCDEPKSAHPGSQWTEYFFGTPRRDHQTQAEGWTNESEHDVLGAKTWGSSERHWNQWIDRDLMFSIRLLNLLKKLKAKGLLEALRTTKPNKEETAWVQEKLRLLEANGIPLYPAGTMSDEDAKWFRAYLKEHSKESVSEWDQKATEKRLKAKLPKSFVDFLNTVGPTTFANVDELEGFDATILGPSELGVEAYDEEFMDEDSRAVKPLTFAHTGHGDCFCFDVQKGKKEYAVYLFKHEMNCFEPYAENFAACIKRFAGGR